MADLHGAIADPHSSAQQMMTGFEKLGQTFQAACGERDQYRSQRDSLRAAIVIADDNLTLLLDQLVLHFLRGDQDARRFLIELARDRSDTFDRRQVLLESWLKARKSA